VIVVGAGILGLAVARELLLRHPRSKLIVLEKEARIAQHQTGHNSGVIHSGLYYAPGSLKARLCTEGARLLYEYCDERGIRYERCGKVVVATRREEVPLLENLYERGTANGVELEWVDRSRLAELEPHVTGLRALHAPSTSIVDFRQVAASFANDVRSMGGEIRTGIEVTGIGREAGETIVETRVGSFRTRQEITCAGLQSDHVAAMTGASETPKIVPFRGSYYVLRPGARAIVRGLVYPVPDPSLPFLGVHFTKQISGEIWAGPNAVLAFAREGYSAREIRLRELWETLAYPGFRKLARRYWRAGLEEMRAELSKRRFVAALRHLVPAIRVEDLLPGPSGVRAQALSEDGLLLDDFWFDEAEGVTHVRNAPSPGATSSLAIAREIVDKVDGSSRSQRS
jgi:L-2-hydroxyglutarate oxidase